MKTFFSISIFSFLSIGLFAQINFEEGFIFTSPNDSITRQINNIIWDVNPEVIEYKNEDGNIRKYLPHEIYGFKVGGHFYKSVITTIDKTPPNVKDIELDKDDSYVERDSLFLKTLLVGDVSLFLFKDRKFQEHYFIEKDSRTIELRLIRRKITLGADRFLEKTESYKNQLKYLLGDCHSIDKKVDKMKFTKRSILRVLNEYYICTTGQSKFIEKKEKNKYHYGLLGGGSLSYIRFKNYIPFNKIGSSTTPYIGGYFEVVFPAKLGRNAAFVELGYTSFDFKETTNGNLDLRSWLLTGGYRNNFYKKKNSSFFLDLGFSGYIFSGQNLILVDMVGGVGFKYKRVVATYRFSRTFDPDFAFVSNKLLVGIHF